MTRSTRVSKAATLRMLAIAAVFLVDPALSFSMSIANSATRMTSLQARRSQLGQPNDEAVASSRKLSLPTAVLSAAIMFGTILTPPSPAIVNNHQFSLVSPANAVESKVVGALKGSGLVFKDTLQIERFEDPKVQGVVLYISNFDRPITEKLSGGNFFNDPSYASVACARTGPISIADNIAKGPQGEEVFEESRSLLFKTLRVQRVYDEEKKTVVYVSYNTRFDKNDDTNKSRFKSSLCAVNLD
jgi:catabolite regulation protein CreA